MNVRRVMVSSILAPALLALALTAEGGARQAQPGGGATVRVPAAAAQQGLSQRAATGIQPEGAEQTRRALRRVLNYYSPNVGRVLALDPMLLQNAGYLEPYPELVAFLNQHPEVMRNAAYYLADFRSDYYAPPTPETQSLRMWGAFMGGLAAFLAFVVVVGAFAWFVKTVVDYRRWYRLSKVQTEAHNKLLDRFTASDELLAYISTPSGKRFLESAPIMLDSAASVSSPVKRILWAVEIGLVVMCAGLGFFVAQMGNVPQEMRQQMFVISVLAAALGLGFVLAAVASFLISKRMGVLTPSASGTGRTDVPSA